MTFDRIAALESEIARLRAEVADVREAIKFESDSTTKHLISINRQLGEDGKWLTQLIYKVMPEYSTVREQIDRILAPDGSSSKS